MTFKGFPDDFIFISSCLTWVTDLDLIPVLWAPDTDTGIRDLGLDLASDPEWLYPASLSSAWVNLAITTLCNIFYPAKHEFISKTIWNIRQYFRKDNLIYEPVNVTDETPLRRVTLWRRWRHLRQGPPTQGAELLVACHWCHWGVMGLTLATVTWRPWTNLCLASWLKAFKYWAYFEELCTLSSCMLSIFRHQNIFPQRRIFSVFYSEFPEPA